MKQTRTHRRKQAGSNDILNVLLFYVLPFFILNGIIFYLFTAKPKFDITIGDTEDYKTTTATITIKSLLPIKDLTVGKDGETLTPEKTGSRTYTVPITRNGVLEVSMKNFNGMYAASFSHINILDDTAPAVDNYELDDDGIITIYLTDSQSGIDYESIYATNSDGDRVFPESQDTSASSVQFEMDSSGLTLHASDFIGNQLQVTFTSHKDGDKEVLNNIDGTETTIRPDETAAEETM